MSAPLMKDGDMICRVFLEWTARRPCAKCEGPGGESHHFPPIGRQGVHRDDSVVPLCRRCHQFAQEYAPGFEKWLQQSWADANLRAFLHSASRMEREQYWRDLNLWIVSRIYTELVPE